MGSIISKIHDDYEDYEYLCEILGEVPVFLGDSFYKHAEEMVRKHWNEISVEDKNGYVIHKFTPKELRK